jgi:hypothetical protein
LDLSHVKTLVVHCGGIGDFLLACPAIACLAEAGPITLLGARERLQLAVAGGIAREAFDLDAIDFASVYTQPGERLKDFLRPFDRGVVWLRDDDGLIKSALEACGIGEVVCHPGLPDTDWREHASAYYLRCVGAVSALPLKLQFRPARATADIVIHPGSGGTSKNWPLERFTGLADALQSQGREVTWITGPAEDGMVLPGNVNRLDHRNLVELGAFLGGVNLYVGNDSGISHLAAAAGCPTLALFRSTDPQIWAPKGEHVRVVQCSEWPSVREVSQIVGEILAS